MSDQSVLKPSLRYEKDGIEIYCGDSLDLLKRLHFTRGKLQSFAEAVITDPPYGVDADKWDAKIPINHLRVFKQITDGAIVWFGAESKIQAMATLCKAHELPWERQLVWAPKFTLSHTMSKGVAYRYHPIFCWQLPNKHLGPSWDVLDIASNTRKQWWKHVGTKPVELMEILCGFACEKSFSEKPLVIDPFMGSGSTLVAAKKLGIRCIGIDINQAYCDIAIKRLEETKACSSELLLPIATRKALKEARKARREEFAKFLRRR